MQNIQVAQLVINSEPEENYWRQIPNTKAKPNSFKTKRQNLFTSTVTNN